MHKVLSSQISFCFSQLTRTRCFRRRSALWIPCCTRWPRMPPPPSIRSPGDRTAALRMLAASTATTFLLVCSFWFKLLFSLFFVMRLGDPYLPRASVKFLIFFFKFFLFWCVSDARFFCCCFFTNSLAYFFCAFRRQLESSDRSWYSQLPGYARVHQSQPLKRVAHAALEWSTMKCLWTNCV